MVVLHYGCLNLKIPSLRGVIIVATSVVKEYHYEQEGTTLTMADIAATDFARI